MFDYTDGAAEGEISLHRARQTYQDLEFRPAILQEVSDVGTTTTILGAPSAQPFAFARTGFTRLMHHEGEGAVARVAQRRGIPYALSTMGTTSIEDIAAVAPHARRWFQLYVWKDRGAAEELMLRAKEAGYEALVLTVNVSRASKPSATPATSYAGADAIVLSNHGGRQLDRAPVPLRLLPDVAEQLGNRTEIHLDTGIMSVADIVAAIALGADAVMVGRAYLYEWMAGGERGVERAYEILASEIKRTMQLLGARTIADLGPQHVTLRD